MFESDSKNYWRKIRNVCLSVRLFQMPLIKSISSPDEVTFNGNQTKYRSCSYIDYINKEQHIAKQRAHDDLSDALKAIKRERELFYYVEKGSSIDQIEKIIMNDPKRYLYEPTSPLRLVNKKNSSGFTPLYIAAKNGFEDVCKILIQYGADQNISVNQIDDYPLVAALRWRHFEVIELLLTNNPNEKVRILCQQSIDKSLRHKYSKYF
ncbi:unnamed protein product (macronuclear) [Paramecium tetraurelia]|uniref:Uncharacterized protein n=1 Tax=Paramecium tetraurelia TaxID=5888 RepID=A0DL89_PARTE|nr:uncharacterized protein GSPATT00018123001 [Paramecium tetraurelia]CAK83806.1 unnamed protein product [Paramecium tetraurelia]|eukprot:XP_001451203.1 hypothetical protein (macronuclear) [Paramecium tetraurelia strain d4-2]